MAEDTRILTIEDEGTVRRSIAAYLEDSGYDILEAANGREGLDTFYREEPDLVLCDLRMPEVDGLSVLSRIAESHPDIPLIIVSGTGDMGDAIESLRRGAWDYIRKPIEDMQVLEHAVQKSLERARLTRENREYQHNLERTNRKLNKTLRQLQDDETDARRIQFTLLPEQSIQHGSYRFSRYLKTSAYLSGDFVDYFWINEQHPAFYIADVSGHGVSSAFVTVLLKSIVGGLLEQFRKGESDTILHPGRVLETINTDIVQRDFDKYLTIFYAVLHDDSNRMTFSNGGQFPYPLLYDGHAGRFLTNKNLPVGLFEQADYPDRTVALPDRFVLAMFSDGVLEILPQRSLQDKNDHLVSLMTGLDVTLDSLVDALGLETLDEPPVDDITLLVVEKEQ
jgi:serine phosphatase RsbU (regulator of sigma subunit)